LRDSLAHKTKENFYDNAKNGIIISLVLQSRNNSNCIELNKIELENVLNYLRSKLY